jgi:hypothetical protein
MKTYGEMEVEHQAAGSGQLHALAALPPRKEILYQLDRRTCGSQSQSGHSSGEENVRKRTQADRQTDSSSWHGTSHAISRRDIIHSDF